MPTYSPTTLDGVAETVTDRLRSLAGRRVVLIDGADAARPVDLAARVSERLRTEGRAADVVDLGGWVRPASLRLEYGHTDEMSYRTAWFDYDGLAREVVGALRDHGRWLPAIWDAQSDRSARLRVVDAGPDQVLIVAGPMLLGRGLHADLTVALTLSPAALRRLTPEDDHWTVDALVTHADRHDDTPDVEVKVDHPDRPALRES
ncbi:hypothetical protein ACTHQY_13580 [Rhodococcoides corynebacterioides]|uniref:hypothetical protein n=1 Tax=Rhodococcoides corynebacterioides TaxID=53972 RepID=UPI003F7E3D39